MSVMGFATRAKEQKAKREFLARLRKALMGAEGCSFEIRNEDRDRPRSDGDRFAGYQHVATHYDITIYEPTKRKRAKR